MSAKPALRFSLYWVNLDPTIGKEMKKTRPCVIVSPDELNANLGTVMVAPLTSTIIDWPFRLTIKTPGQVSSVACDQIRTISKKRLGQKLGSLQPLEQKKLVGIFQEMFKL